MKSDFITLALSKIQSLSPVLTNYRPVMVGFVLLQFLCGFELFVADVAGMLLLVDVDDQLVPGDVALPAEPHLAAGDVAGEPLQTGVRTQVLLVASWIVEGRKRKKG